VKIPFIGAKDTPNKAPCLLFRADSNVAIEDFEKRNGFLVCPKTRRAWGLSAELTKSINHQPGYVLSEMSCAPLGSIGQEPWSDVDITKVIDAAYDLEKQRIEELQRRDIMAQSIKIVVLVASILLIVLVIAGLMQSGTFHL